MHKFDQEQLRQKHRPFCHNLRGLLIPFFTFFSLLIRNKFVHTCRWLFGRFPLPLRHAKNCVMAGQLKEVRNRIKSVQNTQQITKAMKMVSAAKLRRAQDSIIQMRPYAKKLQELLTNIVSNSEGGEEMSLAVQRPVEKVLLIVITSDRGLAGAF